MNIYIKFSFQLSTVVLIQYGNWNIIAKEKEDGTYKKLLPI